MLSSNTASTPGGETLFELGERSNLKLHLDQKAYYCASTLDRRPDAARACDVVVLDQDRVIEAEAV